MSQIQGSGLGNNTNTALVDNSFGSQIGRVMTDALCSGAVLEDFSFRFVQKMDYGSVFQPVYMGFAVPGTDEGSASWHIKKNVISGQNQVITDVLFASGDNQFNKIWSGTTINRTTYPYS